MRTCEDIRLRHPEAWEAAHTWAAASPVVQDARWRWELIRRSNLYRQQADSCRAGQGPSLDLLRWSWGLPCPPGGKDSGELYLDHGAAFASLVTALALAGMDLDSDGRLILPTAMRDHWQDRITEAAQAMGKHPDGLNLPPGTVKAKGRFDHILAKGKRLVHATWTVTVTPPNGCPPWRIKQEVTASTMDWTYITEHDSDQISVTLTRQLPAEDWHQAWPFAPGSKFIPEKDLLRITEATSAALASCGAALPEVVPKKPGGRLRTGDLHKQATALDVAAGKLTAREADLDLNHWTRHRDQGLEKIRLLEAIATQRRAVFDVT